MKKHAKKKPMSPAPAKRMGPTKMPTEGLPMDKEPADMVEGSSQEERYDQRQAARKSRPSLI